MMYKTADERDFKKIETVRFTREDVIKTYSFDESGPIVIHVPGYFRGATPVGPTPAAFLGDVPPICYGRGEFEADGKLYFEGNFGDLYEVGEMEGIKPVNCIVDCVDDIGRLPVLDPVNDGKITPEMIERVKEVKRKYWTMGLVYSLDQILNWPCTLGKLVDWMAFKPDLIIRAIEYSTRTGLNFTRAYAMLGYDEVAVTACYVSNSIVSPVMYREITDEFHKTICAEAHKYGMKIRIHQCGDSKRNWQAIANQGFDIFETIDPLGRCKLSDAKKFFGKKVVLFGNVNTTTLAFGTEKDVENETLKCLEDGMPGGGYALAPGDTTISRITPVENILTMVKIGRKYGHYDNNTAGYTDTTDKFF